MNQPTTPAREPVPEHYSAEEQVLLKRTAREAIVYGLSHHGHQPLDIKKFPARLIQPGACFVTLKKAGQLRGCIGSLEAHRPLILDVAYNAYAAAFSDHRFAPLSVKELPEIDIQLSILSAPTPITFSDERDLIQQLRPGTDGIILETGQQRATFLPSVWESLPDPASFLQHLKHKAGLPADYWAPDMRCYRYTSTSF
jgi:AmmeMemoRadiSam system protein A